MKSPIKYAGSKSKLLPGLMARFPKKIEGNYYEPFLGGGSVLLHLLETGRVAGNRVVVGDLNLQLINLWNCIQNDPELLLETLKDFETKRTETDFYVIRSRYNTMMGYDSPTRVWQAAAYIYLNKLTFNGLMRMNRKGQWNMSWGKRPEATLIDVENLRAVAIAISSIGIFSEDFSQSFKVAEAGDFCFLDPPYVPASSSAYFQSYSSDPFGMAGHIRLRDLAAAAVKDGVGIVLSNSDTETVRDLYKDSSLFKIESVQVQRNISCRGETRGLVGEVIITGVNNVY